jgi:small secreted domain DUF320
MKTWVRKTLSVGVLAAGALLFAPGAAHAGSHQSTGDNNGILNGTQLTAPISVPVNVVGNAIGVAGEANAAGVGANRTEGGWSGQRTGDNNGILNGTQAYLPITVPVNVVGNGLAVLGETNSRGAGVNSVGHGRKAESAHTTEGGWGQSTGDNNGILNGTQLYAPIDIPINVCGNSLAILGGAASGAVCGNSIDNGLGGVGGDHGHHRKHWKKSESGQVTEGARQSTGDNNGILNGTQLYAPISLPVNLAGNSIAVLGEANSQAVAANRVGESAHGGWGGQSTGDNNGILNGTQIAAPISVPINVCGNALGILGAAHSAAGCGNVVGDDFGGFAAGGDDDWNQGDNGHQGHGHQGHGHQGHGHPGDDQNAGDNGNKDDDDQYAGDKGDKDDNGDKGDKGYGDDQGAQPAGNDDDDKGYGATAPAATGSDSDKSGGRRAAEATPVSSLTDTVGTSGLGSLGLLNTLR